MVVKRGESSKISKGMIVSLIVLVVVLILIVGAVIYVVTPSKVCVDRFVSGDADKNININVRVSGFSKPNSFIIEETIPEDAGVVSVEPEPVNFNGQSRNLAWLFYSGGLPIKDTSIIYSIDGVEGIGPSGNLIYAVDKSNPDLGYIRVPLGDGEVCI